MIKGIESNVAATVTMDIRDLIAPVTLLKVENQLSTMKSGQVLEIICLDDETKVDLARIAKNAGHRLTTTACENETFRIFIERK